MQKTLSLTAPLFIGLIMIMIGNGLQGTLLGVRANIEGFDTAMTGAVMSLYYVGYFLGCLFIPHYVSSVGHIRVFAAMASLASVTVLVHGVFPNPFFWGFIRLFTGFSYAGIFIVAESWLNNIATNKTRGKILGLYLFTCFGGLVLGQFLLNLSDPAHIELFILTSVLVSLSLIPISLSNRPSPEFHEPEHLSLRRLYIISPLGLTGALITGTASATMIGFAAVYATQMGMSYGQVALYIAIYLLGGALFQIPIGWLSDKIDRRATLISLSFISAILAFICYLTSQDIGVLFFFVTFLFGGTSLAIYGQCIAHTNDHLTHRQIISASSTLILLSGFGACFGPILASILMNIFGPEAFFLFLVGNFAAIYIFGIMRVQMRDPVPIEEQSEYIPVPTRSTPVMMQMATEDEPSKK